MVSRRAGGWLPERALSPERFPGRERVVLEDERGEWDIFGSIGLGTNVSGWARPGLF